MSEHITHISVFEDSCTIIELSPQFHEAFKISIKKFPDSGLFGSGTRGNHLYAMPIFDRVKKKWGKHTDDDLKQVAFAVGLVTHRAADLIQKPIVKVTGDREKETGFKESDHEIYMDAVTFKYAYEGGTRKSISPMVSMNPAILETAMKSHPGARYVNTEMLEYNMTGVFHGDLLGLHQFTDSGSAVADLDEWLNKLIEKRQRLYEDLRVYIEAFQNPDPQKMSKFIAEQNYYNPGDEIIKLVRAKQHGKSITDINLEHAVELAKEQSQYAQMLSLSYNFLTVSNQFFTNKVSASAAYDALKIFPKSHRVLEQ